MRWPTLLLLLAASCSAGRPGPRRDGAVGSDSSLPPGVDGGPVAFRCEPGATGCFGNTFYTCGPDGVSRMDETPCDQACDPRLSCVLCRPGTRRCDGTVSSFCASNGQAWVGGRDCAEWGSSCAADGFCADACAEAERSNSNVGCEYWPVPLANTRELDPATFDYRVVVANPNDTVAHVRVRRNGADVTSVEVAARGLSEITLPWIDGQSFNVPEGSWQSFVTGGGAYRLTSDVPVIASQFNPFEYSAGGVFSYTNDATLLYPSHVLTGDYVGVSWYPLSRRTGTEGGLGGGSFDTIRYPGYVAIVGVSREPTRVQVTARGAIAADSGGRFPETRSGGSFVFMLQQGEVAHLLAGVPPECGPSRPGFLEQRDCEDIPFIGRQCDIFQTCAEREYDLSGSRIVADRPVAVFGGHVCAYVPTSAQACDHLEVQLPPIQSWGRSYVSAPMGDGSTSGVNIVRVMPAFENTSVTIDPPQGGMAGGSLSPGTFLELEASGPFQVTGTSAVMVAQYLRGQYATMPASQRGDPALTVLVPSEQYRQDYTFILPSSYNASTNGQNYLLIVRPPGLALTLDGAPVTASFAAIGGFEVGVARLEGGTHSIQGAAGFGLIAYGLGSFTSYATPAGLNLEPITILF
ncbi:MAG: IgGFc-binding protein [Sandaracinaceae bacterium]|nr:IgGFc-binding protein [Sandaracinaceae bacterium]